MDIWLEYSLPKWSIWLENKNDLCVNLHKSFVSQALHGDTFSLTVFSNVGTFLSGGLSQKAFFEGFTGLISKLSRFIR
jgi:hypothetical protein